MAATDAALRRLPSDSPAVLRVATALPDSLVFSDGAASALTLRFKLSKKETKLLETLSLLKALDELTTAAGDEDDEEAAATGAAAPHGDEKNKEKNKTPAGQQQRQKTAAASKKRDTMAWVRFYAGEGSGSCVAAMAARVSGEAERRRYTSAHSKRLEGFLKESSAPGKRAPVVTAKYVQAEHGLKPGKEMERCWRWLRSLPSSRARRARPRWLR